MKRALLIFAAIFLGCVFNFGHAYTFLIRPNLIVMLFFAFLSIPFHLSLFAKNHFKVLAVNLLLPILMYQLLNPLDEDLSLIAFIICVAPTAAAAPVIADIMKLDIGIVTVSVLLTTPIIALVLPLLLIYLLGVGETVATMDVVLPIVSLVFIPLIISQTCRIFLPKLSEHLLEWRFLSFPLFLINIFIACGNASHFVQGMSDFPIKNISQILVLIAFLCVLQFQIGHFIGGEKDRTSFGLMVGRKNTMIALWVAISYFSPVVALGPIAYILAHNIYNSVQLWKMEQ